MGGTDDTGARTKLTVAIYLAQRGLPPVAMRKLFSPFGRELKRRYIAVKGAPPATELQRLHGRLVRVCVYRKADRALFDAVWATLRAKATRSALFVDGEAR